MLRTPKSEAYFLFHLAGRGLALYILTVPSQAPLVIILFMRHGPPTVVFAGIDDEPGGDAAAAEGLIKLFGILHRDVPILFAANEQRGGRDILNMGEGVVTLP
jgi:hypothetical protein